MSSEEFLKNLKNIMDTEEELTLETKLEDLTDWDSFSLTAFLSFCDEHTKRPIEPEELKDAKTVKELYEIITSN